SPIRHTTGSRCFVRRDRPSTSNRLETLAKRKGLTLDAAGVHRGRKLIARSEEEIYAGLGLPFIEPELREGTDEIALALKHALPKLVSDQDLRGILHAHTDLSDGV